MSIRILCSWVADRYGFEHLAFAFFIAISGTVGAGFEQLIWALPMSWLALGSMRLGDDLLDRKIDKERFPGRLLVREPQSGRSILWFVPLGLTISALVLHWCGENELAVIAFGVMIFVLVSWYLVRSRLLVAVGRFHSYVLLGKYPALVSILMVASNTVFEPVISLIVYLLMIAYEFSTCSSAQPALSVAMKKWRYLLFGSALVAILWIGGGA